MDCILGIDTSCDDTSVAVLEMQSKQVLSNVVSSQIKIHAEHGGIVPEIASRAHMENLAQVFSEALKLAQISKHQIKAVAVTNQPGLIGCLLVGTGFARALAYQLGVPLFGVNHLEGHLFSPFLSSEPLFPHLGLVVSGGHTAFYRINSYAQIELVGQTVDDAAGEAFDKCAKMLGLGYPGGPVIDKLAQKGNAHAFAFTLAKVKMGPQFMSFSGLKTAAFHHISTLQNPSESMISDFCASFQKAVVEALMKKLEYFALNGDYQSFGLSGGVAMNSLLRKQSQLTCSQLKLQCLNAEPKFCTDNGAMIAHVALLKTLKDELFNLETQATKKIQARKLAHAKIYTSKN